MTANWTTITNQRPSTGRKASIEPWVSINLIHATASLNSAAAKMLGAGSRVVIMVDKERQLIGVRMAQPWDPPHHSRVLIAHDKTKSNSSKMISVASALQAIGVKRTSSAMKIQPYFDNGIFVIPLSKAAYTEPRFITRRGPKTVDGVKRRIAVAA